MRKFLLYSHLVVGLCAAVFLFALGLSGAVLVFENEIDHALNKRFLDSPGRGPLMGLDALSSKLEAANPGYKVISFTIPEQPDRNYLAFLDFSGQGDGKALFVDPHSGNVVADAKDENDWMGQVHRFHTHLVGEKSRAALGWASVGLLLLSLSGLILWWPRKIVSLHREASAKRFTFDLHNAIGLYSAVFLILFSLTGIIIHWERPANEFANKISPVAIQPLEPSKPPAGAVRLGPAELVSAAERELRGARVTNIQFPAGSAARVIMKFPEDHTPAGRSIVMVDPYSGKHLQVSSSRSAPAAVRYVRMWNREIHTGDLWGWPTRLLAFFFSLMLCVMTVTGPILWWNRQGRTLFKRAKS